MSLPIHATTVTLETGIVSPAAYTHVLNLTTFTSMTPSTCAIAPAAVNAAVTTWLSVTPAAHTAVTASNEEVDVNYTPRTVTWATGDFALQRFFWLQTQTMAFAAGSTVTDVVMLDVEAPSLGANATFGRAHAIRGTLGQITDQRSSLTTTSTVAFCAEETTLSDAGPNTVRMSPAYELIAHVWESGVGTDDAHAWRIEVLPATGATTSSWLQIMQRVDAGVFAEKARLTSGGQWYLGNAGSDAAPALGLTAVNTGVWYSAGFRFVGGGTLNALINSTSIQGTGGAVANVTFGLVTDPDTGMLLPASNVLQLVTQGVIRHAIDATGNTTFTQGVVAAGTPVGFTYTGAAHTTLAIAESRDIYFNLARTVQFSNAGGTIAAQRACYINAPTYTAAAALAITNLATLAVSGAPVAGANVTTASSRKYSILSEGGTGSYWNTGGTDYTWYNTQNNALVIENPTLSTVGVQYQNGPMLVLSGRAWNSATVADTRIEYGFCTIAAPAGAGTYGGLQLCERHGTDAAPGQWYPNISFCGYATSVFRMTMINSSHIAWGPISGGGCALSPGPGIAGVAGATALDGYLNVYGGYEAFSNQLWKYTGTTITGGASAVAGKHEIGLYLNQSGATHTNMNNVELNDVYFNLNRTVTWTGGGAAIPSQRAFYITAPTYAAAAAQVLTIAATVAISGPPVQGANVTIGTAYSLLVESGTSKFASYLTIGASGLSGSLFLDEDNMASDSAVSAASQQSIKAYVDNNLGFMEQTVEAVACTGPSGAYGTSTFGYNSLRAGNTDTCSFQFTARKTGNATLNLAYAMSSASANNVELTVSYGRVADAGNPDAAMTVSAPFTFAPGNDTNRHTCNSVQSATMAISVVASEEVKIKVTRSNGGSDTHPGDMYILQSYITGDGAAPVGLIVPWLLLESYTVTGAAVTDITFASVLNGDADRVYMIVYDLFPPPSLTDFDVYPNGAALGAGNGVTQRIVSSNGNTVTGAETQDVLRIARTASRATGEVRFVVKTGANRVMACIDGTGAGVADADGATNHWAGVWRETVTNITSLKLHADVASGFAVGSKVWLYKING